MSTATLVRDGADVPAGSRTLAGTTELLRFALRRDRLRLAIWVLAVGVLNAYTAAALDSAFPTAVDRQARAALMTNPSAVLLGGPNFGLDDYTLGAIVANEVSLTIMIAVAIMSILLVMRHTRAEEESGRAELVRAGVVGRRAQLTSALILAALANVAIAAVVAGALTASGLAGIDSIAFGLGIGLTGLVFAAVAALTAQISEHARAASGSALAVLAAAALIRGIGDIGDPGGSLLSWFSPIAWAQQIRAYVDLRWWPLLFSVVFAAGVAAFGYWLADRRDVGAGLVAPRRGPADASRLLSGATALTVRLQRGTIIGWGIGLLLLGLTVGSLTDAVTDAVAGNPQLASVFEVGGAQSLTDAFASVMILYIALGAAAFAVTSVLRQRGEETEGRVEALLASALSRSRWLGSGLLVTLAGSVLLLLAGGVGMGVSAAAVTGDGRFVGALIGAALAYLPAVLVVAGVATALVGLVPRLSALAWVVLGYALLAGLLGALLGLPDWALKLSPFGLIPALPAADFDVAPLAGLTLLAAGLVAAGFVGFRQRDLNASTSGRWLSAWLSAGSLTAPDPAVSSDSPMPMDSPLSAPSSSPSARPVSPTPSVSPAPVLSGSPVSLSPGSPVSLMVSSDSPVLLTLSSGALVSLVVSLDSPLSVTLSSDSPVSLVVSSDSPDPGTAPQREQPRPKPSPRPSPTPRPTPTPQNSAAR
ncbi:MAG: ABC transporter permease [Pseudonocardia sp.]